MVFETYYLGLLRPDVVAMLFIFQKAPLDCLTVPTTALNRHCYSATFFMNKYMYPWLDTIGNCQTSCLSCQCLCLLKSSLASPPCRLSLVGINVDKIQGQLLRYGKGKSVVVQLNISTPLHIHPYLLFSLQQPPIYQPGYSIIVFINLALPGRLTVIACPHYCILSCAHQVAVLRRLLM